MSTGIAMIKADLLKLRRRRALMAWSALLFAGAQLLFFGFGAVRHASDPAHFGPAGGTHGLAERHDARELPGRGRGSDDRHRGGRR